MRKVLLLGGLFCGSLALSAQEQVTEDSLKIYEVDEVLIVANPADNYLKEKKPLGSLDALLEASTAINMIKRGAYAWEPMINGMSTERSVISIDGMRIFHACTDKMDPVTSYVEVTNLQTAQIKEGPAGSEFGSSIAGSINLNRRKTGFVQDSKWGGSVFAGFESNNRQQIYGGTASRATNKYYIDLDATYRKAENYRSGKIESQSREIDYSQFSKLNLSLISGYRTSERSEWEASLIFDRATDVGYPALPMDISLAQAVIGALSYRHKPSWKWIDSWESKLYANKVTHIMDDTKRPIVPIRMDMPGWTKTVGFYSKTVGTIQKHHLKTTLSGYYNNALAEMTMYPNDPNEKAMFMLTWPDVNTLYGGLQLQDYYAFAEFWALNLNGGVALQHNRIRSEMGYNSLKLFYPEIADRKTRLLKNISAHLSLNQKFFRHQLGLGYGERAPTVSEAYGFYLLNVNDNFDYVGNPELKNEKTLSLDYNGTLNLAKLTMTAKASIFWISDYIIGKPKAGYLPMNITAAGVKTYQSLPSAKIFNVALSSEYRFLPSWQLSGDLSYRYGQGAHETVLPLMQPFSYKAAIAFEKKDFSAELWIKGNGKNRPSLEYGETQKKAFAILNVALSQSFNLRHHKLALKLGAENLLDTYYVPFDNWFNIPSMGRNVYANAVFVF